MMVKMIYTNSYIDNLYLLNMFVLLNFSYYNYKPIFMFRK